MRLLATVDLLAEVLVVCNQDPVFGVGLFENLIIGQPTRLLIDRENFVRSIAEPASDSRPRAFVDQKADLCRLRV